LQHLNVLCKLVFEINVLPKEFISSQFYFALLICEICCTSLPFKGIIKKTDLGVFSRITNNYARFIKISCAKTYKGSIWGFFFMTKAVIVRQSSVWIKQKLDNIL